MKYPLQFIAFSLALLFCLPPANADGKALRIVTEAYPPFVYEREGSVVGTDWDIVQAVFRKIGIEVEIRFCPWKRCLLQMRAGTADAILDISRTPEREKIMHFPKEHISGSATVFFKRIDDKVPYQTLNDLSHLIVGTRLGYHYCEALENPPYRIEPARTLEINLNKLVHNRVDLVLTSYPVGIYTAQEMGLFERVDMVPGAIYCTSAKNYLAFSQSTAKKFDMEAFNRELRRFKQTDAYQQILARYGVNAIQLERNASADH